MHLYYDYLGFTIYGRITKLELVMRTKFRLAF